MDNMTGAIKMAGGILIAVLLVSLVMFMYDRMKVYPKLQAQQKKEEEITEFNSQFHAYEKSQMYGTDVISCLNLAYEYNATNRNYSFSSFLSRNDEGINDDSIQVEVKLKNPLKGEVTVYKYYENIQKEEIVGGADKTLKSNQSLEEVFNENKKDKSLLNDLVSAFKNTLSKTSTIEDLKGKLVETSINEIKMSVDKNEEKSTNSYNQMKSLTQTTEISLTNKRFDYNKNNWSRVVIKTPGSDLKKRAFKWVGTEYNKEGKISKIKFEDISKNN